MQPSVRHRILRRLTAISVAAAFGIIDPAASLLDIPAAAIANVFEDDADEGSSQFIWDHEQHGQIVHLLSGDSRPVVRALVASSAPVVLRGSPEAAIGYVRQLASDPSARVRHAAAKGLSVLLEGASPIDRVELVCQWTVSSLATERAAIARALRGRTRVLVADLAIEQLALDTDAHVRLGAVRAAAAHFGESSDLYRKLARGLTSDPSRLVRRAAARILQQA
jgi:hypothetical protein